MTDTEIYADHYHVFVGFFENGPSPYPAKNQPDHYTFLDAGTYGENWTLAEAKELADEFIRDNPAEPWNPTFRCSDCGASEWDCPIAAAWIIACDQPCRWLELADQSLTEWGEPYATSDVSEPN